MPGMAKKAEPNMRLDQTFPVSFGKASVNMPKHQTTFRIDLMLIKYNATPGDDQHNHNIQQKHSCSSNRGDAIGCPVLRRRTGLALQGFGSLCAGLLCHLRVR
jgi:hypothetical protein